jgi:hypothetical protein
MANASISSRCVVATREDVNSTPPATCLQLADRSDALWQPGGPGSLAPKSMISKDPEADPTPSEAVSRGGLKPGLVGDPGINEAPLGVSSG